MKSLLASAFICLALFAQSQSNIDVLHYRYDITLNDINDTLQGHAEIKCAVKSDVPSISLDLRGLHKNKGMIVTSVGWNLLNSASKPNFVQDSDKLIISLPNGPFKSGQEVYFSIYYKGIPDDGLIISKNKYGDRTFFADNWPNRAHHWIPCVDRPNDKATFEFFVNAPAHYSVISNGVKIDERIEGDTKTTHWKEDVALSTKVMVIGVANFAVRTYANSPTGIPVSAWVYKQDSIPGFRNYSTSPAILKFLIDYIGPYPYNKLANVQSKTIFGGMENASCIFYEELSASADDNVDALLAHETAHQWFGDMASEKSFPHLWLSEGFATYLTHIYIESRYGTDSLNKRMKTDRDEIIDFANSSTKPVVDSTSPLMGLLNANSYQKGGWILHMLRRQLGDTVFHRVIRSYYAAYAGGNADTRDFETICEKVSGRNLRTFFDQWLYSPGVPKLDIQWRYDQKTRHIDIKLKQLQAELFQFPLTIKLHDASGKTQNQTVNVTAKEQSFHLPAKEKAIQLTLDPETSLLFQGSARIIR